MDEDAEVTIATNIDTGTIHICSKNGRHPICLKVAPRYFHIWNKEERRIRDLLRNQSLSAWLCSRCMTSLKKREDDL